MVEYWIGDDADDGSLQTFFDALTAVVEQGTATTVMHGNRDFLLGADFAHRTGVTVIRDDHLRFKASGTTVLLMHGDTLCTDDSDYQQLRATLRDPVWQKDFLTLSFDQRRARADQLRHASRTQTAWKSDQITDVTADAVHSIMAAMAVTTLVHGHTHRPARHDLLVNGQPAIRWVVGDWHPDHAVYAILESGSVRLETFR